MEEIGGEMIVIVESDDDRFPVVAEFFHEEGDDKLQQAIERAEALMDDLNTGRADPRKLAKEVKGIYPKPVIRTVKIE